MSTFFGSVLLCEVFGILNFHLGNICFAFEDFSRHLTGCNTEVIVTDGECCNATNDAFFTNDNGSVTDNVGEEGIAALVEKFKALIEQNGTIVEMEEMGKRKLAYDINYISEGYYVLVKFDSEPAFPAELDRVFGITEGILRSLITLRAE